MRANHFNGILAKADGKPYETIVNQMVLPLAKPGIYSPENIGHFGLNLLRYAHSPRRSGATRI